MKHKLPILFSLFFLIGYITYAIYLSVTSKVPMNPEGVVFTVFFSGLVWGFGYMIGTLVESALTGKKK